MNESGVKRRLSALLVADVVDYTGQMERDTDATVAAWRAARTEVIDPAIADHSGRIVKHTGDGFLAEFATVQGDPGLALARLKGHVAGMGIQVEYSNRIGPAEGASEGGRIILRTDLEPAAEFSVLVHELAHEMLHQHDGEEPAAGVDPHDARLALALGVVARGVVGERHAVDDRVLHGGDGQAFLVVLEVAQVEGREVDRVADRARRPEPSSGPSDGRVALRHSPVCFAPLGPGACATRSYRSEECASIRMRRALLAVGRLRLPPVLRNQRRLHADRVREARSDFRLLARG